MRMASFLSSLVVTVLLLHCCSHSLGLHDGGKQTWGYTEVRPGAQMFWWLYYSTAPEGYLKRPLVIWLQGGPGASSTGFGNFVEIGPLDTSLQNRTTSWVQYANLLFVDNPVGAGFSWVNSTSLLPKNNSQIASDLLVMFTRFLEKVPEFQASVPVYIFSESYGGKMAAAFALRLWKAVEKGKVKCALKGVALGDSWISPIDSVLTWAPFLFSTSLVDNGGFSAINASAFAVKDAVDRGDWGKATELWDATQQVVSKYTNGVSFYNILQSDEDDAHSIVKGPKDPPSSSSVSNILRAFFSIRSSEHKIGENNDTLSSPSKVSHPLRDYHPDALTKLMNGPIKTMLRIVPENVTWGGQSKEVFDALTSDFMRPVVSVVEALLNNTPVVVTVYSGQLDLIVDSMGTLKWVEEMNWPGIPAWKLAPRTPITIHNSTEMFRKGYKNLEFYWVLKAGHMIPADAPKTASEMLQLVTNLKKN